MASLQKLSARAVAKAFLILFLVSGCFGPKPATQDQSPEAKHLRKAADLCNEYRSANKNKVPASIDEVKAWAVKEGKATEEDFVSPRDKEPYGIAASPMGIVLYERTGKGGKRYMWRQGGVFEKPSAEIDQMVESLGKIGQRIPGGAKGGGAKQGGK
jgi:hypothetical protein